MIVSTNTRAVRSKRRGSLVRRFIRGIVFDKIEFSTYDAVEN